MSKQSNITAAYWAQGFVVVLLCTPIVGAQRNDAFGVEGRRAQSAVISLPLTDAQEPVSDAPMAWALAGVVGDIEGGAMRKLFRCVNPSTVRREAPTPAEVVYSVELSAGQASRHMEIVRDRQGLFWLDASSNGEQHFYPLVRDRFNELTDTWPLYTGGYDLSTTNQSLGEVFDVEKPYESSHIELDKGTLRRRVYSSGRWRIPDTSVHLGREQFAARLPKEYDPHRPAGLLVWVSPRDAWRVPKQFFDALDQMNIVCIGALGSGNERAVPDRMQLALHGVAIAQTRWHIDPRRVYVTGMSGGAKITTMLWACFPDVFKAGIPIVGLGSYKGTPTGRQNETWPAIFSKPPRGMFAMLMDHRLAAMTGPPDFNYKNMVPMAKGLERDRLPVRLFDFEDMAHTMPQPEHFVETMRWVDEPYVDLRKAEIAEAEAALLAYTSQHNDNPPTTPQEREMLTQVLRLAPWSEPAWKAYGLLESAHEQNP